MASYFDLELKKLEIEIQNLQKEERENECAHELNMENIEREHRELMEKIEMETELEIARIRDEAKKEFNPNVWIDSVPKFNESDVNE